MTVGSPKVASDFRSSGIALQHNKTDSPSSKQPHLTFYEWPAAADIPWNGCAGSPKGLRPIILSIGLQMNRPQIEEKVIIDTARLLETLPRLTENFEIVFANDGSADRTGELLNELKAKYISIKVTGYQSNKGAGYAFRKALEICKWPMRILPWNRGMSVANAFNVYRTARAITA